MDIDDLIFQSGEWLKNSGPDSNVVLSSRIRLARNLTTGPFPNRASHDERRQVLSRVREAISVNNYFNDSMVVELDNVNDLDCDFLVERHLMSRGLAADRGGGGLIVSREEMLALMVNEEDHLRLQMIQSGSNLFKGWEVVKKIDRDLSCLLPYAFDEDFGYLTACPTNTGTAMRASVMIHLPGLVMTGQIEKILAAINKLNFVARGFYGEGSESVGNFFQVSNQVSLGMSEEEIISKTSGVIDRFIEQEREARAAIIVGNRIGLEDSVFRAHGILKSARVITSQEAIELISMVRLGIDAGMIEGDYNNLNEGFLMIQPAHLQKLAKRALDPAERDQLRAEVIRNLVA